MGGSSPINVQSSQVASGIDIDCMKGKVYWSDTTNKLIRRASMDGKNAESLLSSNLTFPEGIAIDWISRNIYFTGMQCMDLHSGNSLKNCFDIIRTNRLTLTIQIRDAM